MRLELFVYGTLMPGQVRDDLILPWTLRHEAATLEGWLFHLPEGYPALVSPIGAAASALEGLPAAGLVHGVYCVLEAAHQGVLRSLDAYEAYDASEPDSLYLRVRREVGLSGGRRGTPWVYIWNPSRIEALRRRAMLIEGGRFRI